MSENPRPCRDVHPALDLAFAARCSRAVLFLSRKKGTPGDIAQPGTIPFCDRPTQENTVFRFLPLSPSKKGETAI
jgi:hypothetical protein